MLSTAYTSASLEAWLADALRPLLLPSDFAARVIASACDSAARIPAEAQHIRLLVYTRATNAARGQTWGFFRVEKEEGTPAYAASSTHTIMLYLYEEPSTRVP